MDKCPKCGNKLKFWQLSQYCPYCGVNIMFANYEPRFQEDRRIAEMSSAYFRTSMKRFTSAYVSGLPQKIKIVLSLIPLIGLLLPFGEITVQSDLYNGSLKLWVLDLTYNAFLGNGYYSNLGSLAGNTILTETVNALQKLMLYYSIAAVCVVLILLIELLCFIGNKKSAVAMITASVLGIIGFILVPFGAKSLSTAVFGLTGVVDMTVNSLWIVSMLLFLCPIFGAVWCLKKPPVRVFTPEDEKRCEYRAKWKKGEIALLDIPAPIAETEEDKRERAKLIKEAYHENEEVEVNG